MNENEYSIKDLGYDNFLNRGYSSNQLYIPPDINDDKASTPLSFSGGITDVNNTVIAPSTIISGGLGAELSQSGVLYYGKTDFSYTINGYRLGLDNSANTFKFIIGISDSGLDWNVTTANTLTIKGTITAAAGTIGGFTIGTTTISATNLTLTSGEANTANIVVGTGATAGGLNSANTGTDIAFWAGSTFANRATAPFRVNAQGDVVGTSGTFTTSSFNGTSLTLQDIFGNGADGTVTISGDTTLSSDMFYNDLTVNAGINLNTASYRIFVKGTLTNNGTIRNNGSNGGNGGIGGTGGLPGGTAGTAGTAVSSGSLPGTVAGGAGGAGGIGSDTGGGAAGVKPADGSSQAKSLGSDGVAGKYGGSGGTGGSGAGGEGGPGGGAVAAAGTKTGTVFNTPKNIISAYELLDTLPSFTVLSSSAGSAGSNGGGGGGGSITSQWGGSGGGGGGAGGPGGIVSIFAKSIVNSATGIISALGGNGGNGGNGGAGSGADGTGGGGGSGGASGSGGIILLAYSSLSDSGTISVAAGAAGALGSGGAGQGGGASGSNGTAGNTSNTGVNINLQV